MSESVILLVSIVLLFVAVWNLFLCIAAGSIVYQWCQDKKVQSIGGLKPGVYKEVTNALGQTKLVPVEEEADNSISDEDLDKWLMEHGSLAGRGME